MAKLPGIRYGMAVPSTGRQDPMQPVRVAGAQAQAARAVGGAVTNMADMYVDIQEEKGRNSAAEAASEFIKEEARIKTNPNIFERESQMVDLRESVGDNYSTDLDRYGKKEFNKSFLDWSQSHVDQVVIEGIEESYNEQRIIKENHVVEMADSGAIDEAYAFNQGGKLHTDFEKAEINKYIDGKKVYEDMKEELSPDELSIVDIHGIYKRLNDPDDPIIAKMSSEDISILRNMANRIVEDSMGGSVHFAFKLGGLDAIEYAIQQVNQGSHEQFGFENELHKQETLAFMRNVQADYIQAYGGAKSANDKELRFLEIMGGSPLDHNQIGEHFKNDRAIYDEFIFRPAVEGMEPLSQEWNDRVGALSKQYGAPPREAMGYISGNLYGTDINKVVAAAKSLQDIIHANPGHAELTIPTEKLDFAFYINAVSQYGVIPEQAIVEYREGIKKLGVNAMRDSAAIVASMKPDETQKLLDDQINDHPDLDTWWSLQAKSTPAFMADFKREFAHFMPLVGNIPSAAAGRAFERIIGAWGSTDIGRVKLMKFAPNAMIEGNSQEVRAWTDEDFEASLKELDLDADNISRAYAGPTPDGHHAWLLTDENGFAIIDKNNMPLFHVPVYADSPAYRRIKRTQRREQMQDEINANLPISIYTGEQYPGFKRLWLERGDKAYDFLSESTEGLSNVHRTVVDSLFSNKYVTAGTLELVDEHIIEDNEEARLRYLAGEAMTKTSRDKYMNKYPGQPIPPWIQWGGVGSNPEDYADADTPN